MGAGEVSSPRTLSARSVPTRAPTRSLRSGRDRVARDLTRNLLSALAETVGVAVGIFEDGPPAPELLAWRLGELDSTIAERLVSLLNVITGEEHVREGADAVLMFLGGEEHQDHVAIGRCYLDPARRPRILAHRRV